MTKYLSKKILMLLQSAFPNHDDMLTDGLGRLIVYFLYATIFVILLPLVLANKWLYIIDFSRSGQVGDTIGGIMGPFIALIAAFLTFMAFWIQYRANEKQNAIANKQLDIAEKQMTMAEEQERKYAIERFESTLHQMLDVYRKNSEAVKVGCLTGKEAFEEMAAELFYIYYVLDKKLRKIILDHSKIIDDNRRDNIAKYATILFDEKEKRKMFLTRLAYDLFFYGTNVVDLDKVYHGREELHLANELLSQLQKLVYHSTDTVTYRSKLKRLTTPPIDKINIDEYSAHYQMALGHNAQLGHYYRQLLQIVKYISETPIILEECQKYNYAKLLRSQLCDAEQILLFYNSLSIMGMAWNERHGTETDNISTWCYILRYRLIKNIPTNFPFFGITPIGYYQEETKKWKELFGESFFEHETFTLHGNSV